MLPVVSKGDGNDADTYDGDGNDVNGDGNDADTDGGDGNDADTDGNDTNGDGGVDKVVRLL